VPLVSYWVDLTFNYNSKKYRVALVVAHTFEKGMRERYVRMVHEKYECERGMWERWRTYMKCEKGMWNWYVKLICESSIWGMYRLHHVTETNLNIIGYQKTTTVPYSMAPLDSRLTFLRWVISVVDRITLLHVMTCQVLDFTLLLIVFFILILPCVSSNIVVLC